MLNANLQDLYLHTAAGFQDYLTIDTVPVGSAIVPGTQLKGTALPDGTYGCFVPLGGLLNKLTMLLKATIGAGSCTTSGGSVMLDKATTITALAGVGAMVTATRQTVSLAPINGEKYALLTIVVAGGGGTTVFTEAEFFGH
jgi:hypothetical protein